MAQTQQELVNEIRTVVIPKLQKIGTESTKTLEKVAALEEIINNQTGGVSPELQTAFDELKAQVTVVDDLVVDVPVIEEPIP